MPAVNRASDKKFEELLKKHTLHIILFFIGLYVILSILAPVLMNAGIEKPARWIYRIYSPMCHQLAFRSWFLLGAQSHYPLVNDEHSYLISYGEAFGFGNSDFETARAIIGNREMGYKIALCQRDIAIYSALLMFGLIYLVSGKRIKRVPLLVWLILGVVPLGIDGVTQLLNSLPFTSLSPALIRESTPVLRTITGVCFGFFTGWYIFPAMDNLLRADSEKGMTNISEI